MDHSLYRGGLDDSTFFESCFEGVFLPVSEEVVFFIQLLSADIEASSRVQELDEGILFALKILQGWQVRLAIAAVVSCRSCFGWSEQI